MTAMVHKTMAKGHWHRGACLVRLEDDLHFGVTELGSQDPIAPLHCIKEFPIVCYKKKWRKISLKCLF